MFRRIDRAKETVTITFDGLPLSVTAEQTVAAALLGQGISTLRRSVVGHAPRAPYCLMGVCFECLVTVDGTQNRQACMTIVQEGMAVTSQSGARAMDEGR